ncbi:hypothetical protein BASA81_000730 [Batrachochytrium salamandrivorans]|nr:hypothetical protein BASA81_000730 [Batrachochytrium salamandrivorans]
MSAPKTSKMLNFINYRMKVNVAEDNRTLVGTFLAYDKYMNLVLSDCQEYRKIKRKRGEQEFEEREESRTLGLVLLRGESVVSIQVEAPPKKRTKLANPGGGRGVAVGRGEGLVAAAPPQVLPGGLQYAAQPPPLLPGLMGMQQPQGGGRGRRM